MKTVVAVERHGLNPTQPTAPPDADRATAAAEAKGEIIAAFVANLRKSVKSAISDYDPAGVEAYLKSLDPIVTQFGLTRRFVLDLIAEERDARRLAVEAEPTTENLYDLAFAELALGNYHDAIVAARQYVEQETRLMSADPDRHDDHRNRVLSGHLLWKEAAEFAGLRDEARRALEGGSRFFDRDREPVLWADYHEEIAEQHLTHARYELAEELIDAVIDIREEHQPEPSVELAKSLSLWSGLLSDQQKHEGALSVARRAEGMFAAVIPPHMPGDAACLSNQGAILSELGRYGSSEPLLRRALALTELAFGPHHPTVAKSLNTLAALLLATDCAVDAELLLRRALAIASCNLGQEHPDTQLYGCYLNMLLSILGQPTE